MFGYLLGASQNRSQTGAHGPLCEASFTAPARMPSSSGLNASCDLQTSTKARHSSTPRPIRQLEGFRRISLNPGESKVVEINLEPRQFSMINDKAKRVIEPGYFTISVGGKQPGFKGYLDPEFTQVLTGRIKLTGKEVPFGN